MGNWKTNWTDGETVFAEDLNRMEENGKATEETAKNAKPLIVIYGKSTADEIEAGIKAGKMIFCVDLRYLGGVQTAVYAPLFKRISATNFIFLGGDMTESYNCVNSSWSTSPVSYPPATANILAEAELI